MLSFIFELRISRIFPRKFSLTLAMLAGLGMIANGLPAQQAQDSLLATFAGIEDDSVRTDSMLTVVYELSNFDPLLGLWLCGRAEAEPQTHGKAVVRARALNLRGIIYFKLNIYDLAMSNLLEALRLADSLGERRIRANAINNIGNVQEVQRHYEEALISYRNARASYLTNGNSANATIALSNVALVYFDLKQYDKAIEVCDSVFLEIEDPQDAAAFARVYGLLGEIHLEKKEYPTSLAMFNKSVELAAEGEDDFAFTEDLIMRATVKNELKMYDSALVDIQLAMRYANELESSVMLVDCYDNLAAIAKSQGNAALALAWMEKSKALSDSIQAEESETTLANYQALYEVNLKDAEIDLLSKDKEIQQAKLNNVWYLFGLVSVVLLAMVSVVVILVRSNKARRRINLELQGKNEQILTQHQQISVQNTALMDQNEQLNNLNHEMSGLLHVVAHDLKAPLNQVTGLLSVVEDEGNLNPTQEKMLSMAKKVTNNAGNLVKDLVELGSAEQQAAHLQKVPVPLKSLVAEVAAAFSAEAARKSIVLETALPADEVICQTEPNQLRRVLENLISNALKFSPSGKNVQISLTQDAGYQRISIQDQGPGISPADQKNLYRKFHKLSARPTGGESSSGLGLAIVKTLVEQLGGEIGLTSELGVGSSFVVRMPSD